MVSPQSFKFDKKFLSSEWSFACAKCWKKLCWDGNTIIEKHLQTLILTSEAQAHTLMCPDNLMFPGSMELLQAPEIRCCDKVCDLKCCRLG